MEMKMLYSVVTCALLSLGADTIEGIGPIGKIEKVGEEASSVDKNFHVK